MVRPRRSSAASDESGGTAGNQVCFLWMGGGWKEGRVLILHRNWGACMITLRRSYCWVLAAVGSMSPLFVLYSKHATDKHQILSAAPICEG